MALTNRKPLGQIAYETEKRERGRLDYRVENEWPEWDELEPAERRVYTQMASAVQKRDRERQRRDKADVFGGG